MPSGTKSTQTTQVQAPQAVNQPLQQLFSSLFGGSGGAGSAAVQSLMGIMGGQTMQKNVGQLYNTLQASTQGQYQEGLAGIKAAGGAGGTRFSTDTQAQMGSYTRNYLQNLTGTASQMGLQELGTQAGVATNTLGIFSQAANEYYSPGQTTTGTTQQTGIGAWADPILGAAGLAFGGATAAGSFGQMFHNMGQLFK